MLRIAAAAAWAGEFTLPFGEREHHQRFDDRITRCSYGNPRVGRDLSMGTLWVGYDSRQPADRGRSAIAEGEAARRSHPNLTSEEPGCVGRR